MSEQDDIARGTHRFLRAADARELEMFAAMLRADAIKAQRRRRWAVAIVGALILLALAAWVVCLTV